MKKHCRTNAKDATHIFAISENMKNTKKFVDNFFAIPTVDAYHLLAKSYVIDVKDVKKDEK
jgi:hypothetical protein